MPPVPSLRTVPLAALTDAWATALRGAPAPTRAAVLEEADALRTGSADPDDSWRALAAYRALVDDALEAPEATARAVWMAVEDPAGDAVTRRFAEVACRAPGDEGVRGACAWARCEGDAAHLRAAVARLLELGAAMRDRADAVAFAVLHALTDVFLREHRELEALLAARRAADVARVATDLTPVDRAHAASLLARAFVALGDATRLRAHLPALLAAAAAMPEPDATRARVHAHLLLARAATDEDDLETAAKALAAAAAAARADVGVPGFGPAILRATQLRIAIAQRDADALERHLAAPVAGARGGTVAGVGETTARAALAALRGRADEAADHAARVLAALERSPLAPSSRLAHAVALARALADAPDLGDLAADAWHLAADAALARLRELDRSARDLGPLLPLGPDDRDALASHRTRFVASHREVLEPLRERLADVARRGPLPAWATPEPGDLLLVCAWCLSVRDRDGAWLPVGHLVHGAQSVPMTHGACPHCLEAVVASVRRDVGGTAVSEA